LTYDLIVRAWKLFVALDAVVLAAAAVAFVTMHGQSARTVRTGVVLVDANLGHGNRTEGTGIVLTRDVEVLTNNHVIEGATSVRVTVPETGRAYRADILGYDVRVDAAVLKLRRAHGLRLAPTVPLAPRVGQEVLAVGGSTGTLRYSVGHITGLHQSVTANDETGGSESLRGLIEFDAGVQPGDSGGPLFDVLGNVLGVDTAGLTKSNFFDSARRDHESYAIPIGDALGVAHRIETGLSSATLHVGATAFLGIELDPTATRAGAVVAESVAGSPAARIGLGPGARITTVDGQTITEPQRLVTVLLAKRPGDSLALVWRDRTGGTHSASVKLEAGPAL
jgi:S1-C subfamily serine protease